MPEILAPQKIYIYKLNGYVFSMKVDFKRCR